MNLAAADRAATSDADAASVPCGSGLLEGAATLAAPPLRGAIVDGGGPLVPPIRDRPVAPALAAGPKDGAALSQRSTSPRESVLGAGLKLQQRIMIAALARAAKRASSSAPADSSVKARRLFGDVLQVAMGGSKAGLGSDDSMGAESSTTTPVLDMERPGDW